MTPRDGHSGTAAARLDYYVDPLAQVAPSVRIGGGTKIWAFTRILDRAVVGARCQLGQGVFVDRNVSIGDRVKIQNNVSLYEGVAVGDGVFLGPSCVFTNVMFPRAFVERKSEFSPTTIARGVTVGANATIVCGVELREFCFVGAGAVVVEDVPAFAVVVGNPARQLGWACACGERLPGGIEPARCDRCGLAYVVDGLACQPMESAVFERWWMERMDGEVAR